MDSGPEPRVLMLASHGCLQRDRVYSRGCALRPRSRLVGFRLTDAMPVARPYAKNLSRVYDGISQVPPGPRLGAHGRHDGLANTAY